MTRAMSFSLGYVVLYSVTKILATGRVGRWSTFSEPALTFQLSTSRCFLGTETVGLGSRATLWVVSSKTVFPAVTQDRDAGCDLMVGQGRSQVP